MFERIDHIVCVVPDLESASAAHEKLGLSLTPPFRFESNGVTNRALFVGENAANLCYLELISVFDADRVRASGRSAYLNAGAAGLGFGVGDVHASAAHLTKSGYAAPVESVDRPEGSRIIDIASVETGGAVPFRVTISEYPESWEQRYDRSRELGRLNHTFPLKRLDHLAAVAPDIEGACRFWSEVLGVPVHGEIRTSQLIIRQLKIGDAILELLGPTGPDSPMASRPASLAGMAAWEVSGPLDEAVALARERGFSPSDPEAGVIPGTRRSTIPPAELGGIGMQLLEYV